MTPPGEPSLLVRDAVGADFPAVVAIANATIPGGMVTADTTPAMVEDRLPWFWALAPLRAEGTCLAGRFGGPFRHV